jgi:segregation and condensation protein B
MDFLKKISKARPFRLSGPALEVLSIIAYKQPIIKNEIDQIRGVESGHLVRALMEKGLVSFEGKTDLPGKPMAYSTTRKFLEIFGLRNLQELPTLSEIDQLLPEGIGEEEEKETLSDVTSSMSQAIGSSYSEGEEELTHITEKINSIDTSSEFFEQEKQRQKEKRDRERAEDIREALAVGEPVEAKDVKWLERYETQIALAQAAAQKEAVAPPMSDLVVEDADGSNTNVQIENENSTSEESEVLFEQQES